MNTRSAKNKGRKLQQWVRDKLLKFAPSLQQDDVRSTSMGCGGVDIQLSPRAQEIYPFDFECKNQEKLNIWKALEQAEANAKNIPVVAFKRNRSEVYVALKFEDFIKIQRKENGNEEM